MSPDDSDDTAEPDGTREIRGFVTYRGDGFASVRPSPERGDDPAPTPASNRRYLRDGLPAIYREDPSGIHVEDTEPFGIRFVGALEQVLDPLVAVIDLLPAHFDPELAPLDILDLCTKWLGLSHREAQPSAELRKLVLRAADLGRLRGTVAGMRLALELNFPQLPLRIQDGGGIHHAIDGELPAPAAPHFVVYCDKPIERDLAAEVARVIESVKPVHVSYRLRIRGSRQNPEPGG